MESECGDGGDRCYLLLDDEASRGSCQASPAAPSLGEGTEASFFVHPMPRP